MRTLCDACESAAAKYFCPADEAALCHACDDKVHMCNKLASRHVRVGIADPGDVPKCDICSNAPAFFYCELDGSSLCLQCDMAVHVGGKKTHKRYLLLRQRVEFPGDKIGLEEGYPHAVRREANHSRKQIVSENDQNRICFFSHVSPVAEVEMDKKMIDLNARPQRTAGQSSTNQEMDTGDANLESTSVVPANLVK